MFFKASLRGCSALGAVLGVSLVTSQPARAQQQNAVVGEIIVTARRMEERLQDVPISISAFDQKQLNNLDISFGADLAAYVPSLQVASGYGADNTVFSLRGFGQDLRESPSVAVYFADVVEPRGGGTLQNGDGAPAGTFFDLQNVQVLKGPQGTLFGRNTTGGAVLLVPQRPKDRYEGYVEGSYGNYDMARVQAVVNIPVGDRLRLRAGINRETRDGYEPNISGVGPSNFADMDYLAARLSAVFEITPDLETYTVATFNRSQSAGAIQQVFGCDPNRPVFGALSCAQVARDQAGGRYAVDNNMPDAHSDVRQWQVINTTSWQAGENLTVKNIASYAQMRNSFFSTIFGVRWLVPPTLGIGALLIPTGRLAGAAVPFADNHDVPGGATANQETYTEELQLQGKALDNRLTWQAGVYLEGSNTLGTNGDRASVFLNCPNIAAFECSNVLSAFLGPSLAGSVQQQTETVNYHNFAVYEQATFQLSPEWRITEGLRYTSDVVQGHANRFIHSFPSPNTPVAACFTDLSPANGCYESVHTSSSAPTWLIDLDYTPSRDVLIYAKYARGYRQGSVNETGAFGHFTFEPEHVNAYEVGAKTSWRGAAPGTFNIAAFWNKFDDQQLQAAFQPRAGSGVSPAAAIVNGGASRTRGVELETTVDLPKGWTLNVAYTYLDTKLLSLTPIALDPTDVYGSVVYSAQAGTPLPLSPKHKVAATMSYRLPLDPALGPITASATYAWTDSQIVMSGVPFGTLPAYGLLNLNVNWSEVGGKPIDLELFMTNATNRFYATYVSDDTSAVAFASRTLGEPRMFGVRARVRFD